MTESVRHQWVRAAARFAVVLPLAAASALGAVVPLPAVSAAPVTGAVSTTTNTAVDGTGHCHNGNEAINCNQYDGKEYVWLSGLPDQAGLNDGTYFFAVTVPGGQGNNITANPNDGTDKNLSDTTAAPWTSGALNEDGTEIPSGDSYTNRTFTLTDGVITYGGSHELADNKIRLMPYDDTTNPGGVYIMAVCQIADAAGKAVDLNTQYGEPGINPSLCKYDAFMVRTGTPTPQADDLTVSKNAEGTYTNTYGWTISKSVDQSDIAQSDQSAEVTYSVGVKRTEPGTVSDVKVQGTITVTNPNEATVYGVNISDTLSDGTTCSVAGGSTVSIPKGPTDFSYTCDLDSLPQSGDSLSNVVSITWPLQDLGTDGLLLPGSAGWEFENIPFASSDVNACVDVTDSIAGAMAGAIAGAPGRACGDYTWTYPRTIVGTPGTCMTFDNTATIVQTNQSSSAEVKLCVGADLTVSKTVVPTFNRAYLWNIAKSVDKTLVKQSGGTTTFNYVVTANQTGVTDSGWAATGAITITNPNDWEPIAVTSLSDVVGNDGTCTIDSSVSLPLTIPKSSSATVAYSCTFSGGSSGTNTATAGWDKAAASTPAASATGTAGFAFTTPTTRVNQTVTVNDAFNGNAPTTLGTLTGTDSAPFVTGRYPYARTVNVPAWGCVSYPNKATIVETDQSASQTVKVCRTNSNGLTMGYWQNKNGQARIFKASAPGLCTYLAAYPNVLTLPVPCSSTNLPKKVSDVISAANASGTGAPMFKGQFLATALSAYFNTGLANTKIAVSPAIFDTNCISVSGLLTFGNANYAALSTNKTVFMAVKDVYDAINNNRAVTC